MPLTRIHSIPSNSRYTDCPQDQDPVYASSGVLGTYRLVRCMCVLATNNNVFGMIHHNASNINTMYSIEEMVNELSATEVLITGANDTVLEPIRCMELKKALSNVRIIYDATRHNVIPRDTCSNVVRVPGDLSFITQCAVNTQTSEFIIKGLYLIINIELRGCTSPIMAQK